MSNYPLQRETIAAIATIQKVNYNQYNQVLRIDKIIELMSATIREQLHQQIDQLPDHLVEQIANFTQLLKHKNNSEYNHWQDKDWQEFSLEQFFQEKDEIEYFLEDAQEVYHQ